MQEQARILVVDDNHDSAEMLGYLMQLEGCDVRTSTDPLVAVAMAQTFQPSVAFVDLVMPGMTGWDLAPKLASSAPGCRLIALTGRTTRADIERSKAAGFEAHLFKPVVVEDLLRLLNREQR